MSYYESGKITYDEADRIVDRFIEESGDDWSRVTSIHVARASDVEVIHHNLIRINSALERRLEPECESGAKATRYRI